MAGRGRANFRTIDAGPPWLRRLAWPPVVLLACAAFMLIDVRTAPIVLWDESRLAVNALEMRLHGLSLVTTYGFAPDLWNTKPPLLIWLMDASLRLFGPGEWAVRAPSIAAALATLAMVIAFTRKVTGSARAGALAAVLLALSVGFFGEHGARTGDYDALLCCFTTAYLCVLFFALHRARPPASRLLLAGALVACAVLTKSIAGLAPGAGVLAYLLLTRRLGRAFATPWSLAAAAVAAAPVAAYYGLREAAAPGYLAAVWGNDINGRFLTALDRHGGPPWYYLKACFIDWLFSAGPLALAAPFALPLTRGKARQGLLFALCVALGVIAVVSASSTKLPQYVLPALPFIAIAVAIATHAALGRLQSWAATRPSALITPVRAKAVLALALALIAARAIDFRTGFFPGRQFYPQALYGELFAALARQGVSEVQVVEHGVDDIGVEKGYAPQLRFYALAWAERGLRVETLAAPPNLGSAGPVLASCDPLYTATIQVLGPSLAHPAGCIAVHIAGH